MLISTTTNSKGATILITEIVGLVASERGPISVSGFLVMAFAGTTTTRVGSEVSTNLRRGLHAYPNSPLVVERLSLLPNTRVYAVSSFYLSLIERGFFDVKVDHSFAVLRGSRRGVLSRSTLGTILSRLFRRSSPSFVSLIRVLYPPGGSGTLVTTVGTLCACVGTRTCPVR